jgi:hypothetical protein
MGAPYGNCNAAKNKSACRAGSGRSVTKGARKYLHKITGRSGWRGYAGRKRGDIEFKKEYKQYWKGIK